MRSLFAAVAVWSFVAVAHGQAAGPPDAASASSRPAVASSQTQWDEHTRYLAGTTVRVVTLAHTNRRYTCHVASVTEAQLMCEAGAFGKRRVFRRQDVAALIQPAVHDDARRWILSFLGTGAGLITGACLLAPISLGATIPLAVIGSLFIITTPAFAIGDNAVSREELLYLRPGLDPASVRLKV